MHKLKFFDYSRNALLTFEDGTTQKAVTFENQEPLSFVVRSTGQLNVADASAALDIQRVMVIAGNGRRYVNVMSRAAYVEMAGAYADTLYNGNEMPAINVAALTNPAPAQSFNPLSPFVASAYAQSTTPLAQSFVTAVSGFANVFLPLEAVETVYEQIQLALAGSPDFDPVRLALSSLEVITGLPVGPGRLLGPVAETVSKVYVLMSRKPKAMRALAGLLDDIMVKAKRGQFDSLGNAIPYLLIAAEMYLEAPDAVELMINSIDSLDDLWAWIDYMNLPADGWTTDGPPPPLQLGAYFPYRDGTQQMQYAYLPDFVAQPESGDAFSPEQREGVASVSWLIPRAYAQQGPRRFDGRAFARMLREFAQQLGPDLANNPKLLSQTLRTMNDALRGSPFYALRTIANTKYILGSGALLVRHVGKRAKLLLKGASDLRVHPLVLLAVSNYLHDQYKDRPEIYAKLVKKWLFIVKDLVIDTGGTVNFTEEKTTTKEGLFNLSGGSHGAVFHLMMLAYYTMSGEPVAGIEVPRRVWLYGSESDAVDGTNKIRDYLRYVDILLKEGALNEATPETWVELKSLKARGEIGMARGQTAGSGFGQWKLGSSRKSSVYHKQISLERVARKRRARLTQQNGSNPVPVTQHVWWFQKFSTRVKNEQGAVIRTDFSPTLGTEPDVSSIYGKLARNPSGDAKEIKVNLDNFDGTISEFGVRGALLDRLRNSDLIPSEGTVIDEILATMTE